MKDLIKKARYVFVCGNGGSAANAEHFVNDLFSKKVRAICLNSNVSIMTMIANDFGYQYVFSRQLDVYANSDDLLITFSCSGTSPNILEAIMTAELKGMKTYQFETFGKDHDYENLEDKHLKLAHKIKKQL
jgi:D-sedoheptulose 7-phosphate isomerase